MNLYVHCINKSYMYLLYILYKLIDISFEFSSDFGLINLKFLLNIRDESFALCFF